MQLDLFPELLPPPKAEQAPRPRRVYTTRDIRAVRLDYTEGWLKGPQMAKKLGVPYPAFKQFVKRNPQLKKGYHTKESTLSETLG